MSDLQTLRRQLRARRSAVTGGDRRRAEQAALARLKRHPRWQKAHRVALFMGHGGELDPSPAAQGSEQTGKSWYLPALHPVLPGTLRFHRWHPGELLVPNRFGIGEPPRGSGRFLSAHHLDIVIVPLVGFDERGNRLGMGGGFYDRTFAFVQRRHPARRPFLLGLAFDCQQVDTLTVQAWDVRLDGLITESRSLDFTSPIDC